MNKMNLICTVAFVTIASAVVIAGPGGGNQPGGNQPGGGSSATWTFDTFLASSTTTSGLIIREGIIIGYDSPTSATVASTVTDIAEGALAGCTTLTGIDLSATSITEIPESAFAGCSNLATVILYHKKLYISDEIGFEKPDVRYFERVFEDIEGFDPRRALIIGDSLTSDIKGAVSCGIDCCYFTPSGNMLDGDIRPTYTITELWQLHNILN